jgi:hypothetical protein|tara:strand:- start:505 stop:732 length:228 start_codon:yes stop_codon:yes gene_type:complete
VLLGCGILWKIPKLKLKLSTQLLGFYNPFKGSRFMKIKTVCGIEKYNQLRVRTGFWARLRLYWFLVFGSLRDMFK